MIDFNTDVMPLKNKFYRLALRMVRDDAEAQDITQETLIRLWKRLDTLATVAEAEALGITTCRNLSLDALGRAGRNHETLDQQTDIEEGDTTLSPLSQLMQHDRRQYVQQQINQLPLRQRTMIQLRDIEGHSYREIAQMTELTEEQVKITLFRARQALKASCQNKESYGL